MKRLVLAMTVSAIMFAASATTAWAQPPRGAVYVISQGLCYDTFVAVEQLPSQGPFQLITPSDKCGPGSSETMFGPGDVGYVGGRWVTPTGDHFLCPLVGSGYPPPQ